MNMSDDVVRTSFASLENQNINVLDRSIHFAVGRLFRITKHFLPGEKGTSLSSQLANKKERFSLSHLSQGHCHSLRDTAKSDGYVDNQTGSSGDGSDTSTILALNW